MAWSRLNRKSKTPSEWGFLNFFRKLKELLLSLFCGSPGGGIHTAKTTSTTRMARTVKLTRESHSSDREMKTLPATANTQPTQQWTSYEPTKRRSP